MLWMWLVVLRGVRMFLKTKGYKGIKTIWMCRACGFTHAERDDDGDPNFLNCPYCCGDDTWIEFERIFE